MMNLPSLTFLFVVVLGFLPATHGGTPLRELSTDRPDTTESPFTVDKGHYQFEVELASLRLDGGEWTEYTLGEINAKFGMTANSDCQVLVPLFTRVRDGATGYGDMEVRVKVNLWGNDGGTSALALMPFLKIPTAADAPDNDALEGGLILPYAFAALGHWQCAVMAEIDLVADDDGDDHHLLGVLSATASHGLTESTSGFLEIVGLFPAEPTIDPEAYFNTGLTWALSPTWQLDGGIRVGLTRTATDLTPFVGLSAKF